jgi:hypothetical protein
VLICYSPLVQNAATMQRCTTDPDLGWVLEADPRVSCETSTMRTAVVIHAGVVVAILGVGLPLFVLRTTYNLRQENRLSETNVYVALYEWYGCERSGHERSGRKRSGCERSGRERSGCERRGHERSGRERSGRDELIPGQK